VPVTFSVVPGRTARMASGDMVRWIWGGHSRSEAGFGLNESSAPAVRAAHRARGLAGALPAGAGAFTPEAGAVSAIGGHELGFAGPVAAATGAGSFAANAGHIPFPKATAWHAGIPDVGRAQDLETGMTAEAGLKIP
jgi:hypothetical protein